MKKFRIVYDLKGIGGGYFIGPSVRKDLTTIIEAETFSDAAEKFKASQPNATNIRVTEVQDGN